MKLYQKPQPQTDATHPGLRVSADNELLPSANSKRTLKNNLNFFKWLRAKARKTIKQAKKVSGQDYVNKLNSSTKTNTVWKMIRKISGKNQSTPLKHLIKNNTQVTNIKDIDKTQTGAFSANSSTNSNTEFHKYKDKKEKQKVNYKSDNTKSYNEHFSLSELKEVIRKSHNIAVGPDEIHNDFLRQLPPKFLEYLFTALNNIWEKNLTPRITEKNNLDASIYCPIALANCLCKTMERIVNKKLVWFIESNNLFTNFQCGSRSRKSTMDHVVR